MLTALLVKTQTSSSLTTSADLLLVYVAVVQSITLAYLEFYGLHRSSATTDFQAAQLTSESGRQNPFGKRLKFSQSLN